ncbi:MAG: hypothetical protein C5B45_01155, partial [Chlamydiae bacterium]
NISKTQKGMFLHSINAINPKAYQALCKEQDHIQKRSNQIYDELSWMVLPTRKCTSKRRDFKACQTEIVEQMGCHEKANQLPEPKRPPKVLKWRKPVQEPFQTMGFQESSRRMGAIGLEPTKV